MIAPRENPEKQEGRLGTLQELIASYSKPLTRYFRRRTASDQDVPDLVQEVFLRLSRIDDPGGIQERDSFIFVTAANVLRDRARRDKVRHEDASVPIETCDLPGSDFAPDRVLEGRQAAERLREVLEELPERTRDVFVLRMLEGCRMTEVARAMGISTRAAEKHQARALAYVAERLADYHGG
ncbi:sigma-70 family RNA polymerase sigma factor [Sphingomonas sp. VNH70]|uniref:RNA polymerase sigma factor n=1 Tax=Sphingomonas silueang TaxID=3156617 RepID=UPI0032B530FF